MWCDKGVAGHLDKSCCPQHHCVMVWAAARLWRCSTGAVCGMVACPMSDDVRDKALPRFRAAHEAIASQDGHAASRLQPLQGVLGHTRLIESVERFPNGD